MPEIVRTLIVELYRVSRTTTELRDKGVQVVTWFDLDVALLYRVATENIDVRQGKAGICFDALPRNTV